MFHRIIQIVAIASFLAAVATGARAAQVAAHGFYHAGFNHFFMTSFPNEATLLDAGTISGWARTLIEFKVEDAAAPGLVPVCRYFSTAFAPRSSHFYSAFANECSDVSRNPNWTFEADAFYVRIPDAGGACPAGTTPIFRWYNDGQSGAPNHKYTPYRSERDALLATGWVPEGVGPDSVGFCVPAFFDVAQARTQAFANATWQFTYRQADGALAQTPIIFGAEAATGDPEFPYATDATDREAFAGWEPFAGKIFVLLLQATLRVFVFDYTGGASVAGCVYEVADLENGTAGPCRDFTAAKI